MCLFFIRVFISRRDILFFAVVAIMTMMAIVVSAQNNKFHVDDRLYALYVKGEDKCSDDIAIVLADSLEHEGMRLGDNKAVCLSYALRMRYLTQEKFGVDTVVAVAEKMKAVARRLNESNYYYYATVLEVQKMLAMGDDIESLHCLIKMNDDAESEHSAFGKYTGHLTMGDIYAKRRNYTMALYEYSAAKELVVNSAIGQSPQTAIHNIARCQMELGRYEEALESVSEMENSGRMSTMLAIKVVCIKCISQFLLGRVDEFRDSYNEYAELRKVNHEEIDIERRVITIAMLADGRQDLAVEYVNKYMKGVSRFALLAKINHYLGDYETAYKYIQESKKELLVLIDETFSRDISKLSSTIEEEMLRQKAKDLEVERIRYKLKNQELEQQRSRLKLDNTRLDMEHQRAVLELQKSLVQNRNLELNNQSLKINQQQVDLETQNESYELEQRRLYRTETQWALTASIFGFFVIAAVVYYILRERDFRKLGKMNGRLLEAQLNAEKMQKMAEDSEARKTMFIQSMSHEIRTPLNAICGFSQILTDANIRKEMSAEERERIGDIISNNTETLITIVSDILYLSDVNSGKYKMALAEVSAVDICKKALARVIDKKPEGVELNFATNLSADFKIVTDASRVERLLVNLLSNAQKHTTSGEICLYCVMNDEDMDNIEFSVNDTGEGVPKEKSEEIFDSFTKLDHFKQGTGLGLAICRLIAEKLGGSIRLDTEYKDGARFVFIHPLHAVVPEENREEVEGVA